MTGTEAVSNESVYSHELNNIINIMAGIALILKTRADQNTVDPDIREKIELLNNVARRAVSTAQNLNSLRHSVFRSSVDLADYIRQYRTIADAIAGGSIRCCFNVRNNSRVRINTDNLDEILTNLVKNAVEATKHKADGSITISVETEFADTVCATCGDRISGKHTVLAVSDTGSGIDKKDLGRIFSYSFTTKEKGSGIGLYVVRIKTHMAGGHITVDTSPEGTSFRLYFPSEDNIRKALEKGPIRGNAIVISGKKEIIETYKGYLAATGFNTERHATCESVDIVVYDTASNNCADINTVLKKYPAAAVLCIADINGVFHKKTASVEKKDARPDERVHLITTPVCFQDFAACVSNIMREF